MTINEDKLKRQKHGIDLWIKAGAKGTLEWATAMGKTFTTRLIIERMLERESSRSTIVIVPTIQLKEQWEYNLTKWKVKNVTVYVINTIVLNELSLKTSLLVLDEIHRFASEEFSKVFELIQYQFILGLTATMDRLDGKHTLLLEKAPIVDTITQEEAKDAGWIADFFEYNLGIELTEEDRIEYDRLNKEFHKRFAFFGHDLKLAIACMNSTNAAEYAGQLGFYDAKTVLLRALAFNKAMKERKEYLYKAKSKMILVLDIIRRFQLKTVTFSESVDFADEITEKVGDIAVCYHSKLKTQIRNGKKFGKTKLRREAIQKFADNRYKVRVINTAKALDQGFDVEDVELAVITSSTTNPTQHIQRVGRAVRHYTYKSGLKKGSNKKAIIINIYIKDSQDLKWLTLRQTDPKTKKRINPNVIWIDHIDEIFYGKTTVPEGGDIRATCD